MFSIIKKFFKYKITILPPSKSKVLIYSSYNLNLIHKIIDNRIKYSLIDFLELNLFIFFKSIFKFKLSKLSYINAYISHCSPSVIITSKDDDIRFYQLKYYHKSITTIAIQYGIRTNITWNLFQNYKNQIIKNELDHLVCFSESEKNKYSKYIKINNFHLNGSIINNYFPISFKKNNDVIYISQLRLNYKQNPILFTLNNREYYHDEFYKIDRVLLPIVDSFCKKNNLNLIVLGAGKSPYENDFFSDILGHNNFSFNKKRGFSSYERVSRSRFVVSIDSTFGLESFARKIPTVFFPARYKYIDEISWKSSFENLQVPNQIWCEEINRDSVYEILQYIYDIAYNDFINLWNDNYKKIMSYDNNNNNLKKLINSLI